MLFCANQYTRINLAFWEYWILKTFEELSAMMTMRKLQLLILFSILTKKTSKSWSTNETNQFWAGSWFSWWGRGEAKEIPESHCVQPVLWTGFLHKFSSLRIQFLLFIAGMDGETERHRTSARMPAFKPAPPFKAVRAFSSQLRDHFRDHWGELPWFWPWVLHGEWGANDKIATCPPLPRSAHYQKQKEPSEPVWELGGGVEPPFPQFRPSLLAIHSTIRAAGESVTEIQVLSAPRSVSLLYTEPIYLLG